ncbi:MAG: redoxin domain-containing protein [Firmicutes bacterium]|nr:redoxin domain-containing protein [Bacillota bacterium]
MAGKRLNTGDKFPNFTYNTGWEEGKTTDELFAKADKTVFWVLRYIGCSVCRLDVEMIRERYSEFQAKGAQVCVLMQSDQAHIKKEFGEDSAALPFDLICDNAQEIYQALDIKPAASKLKLLGGISEIGKMKKKADKCKAYGFEHGDYEGNELQLPAMFIVGKDGTVEFAHYAKGIVDMPVIDEVLAKL